MAPFFICRLLDWFLMDAAITDKNSERLPVLDGLRALAILLILSLHIVDNLYMKDDVDFLPLSSQFLSWFLMNGWVGVHLFFVLSGFLITRQLRKLDDKNAPRRIIIGKFMRHRLCRIIPAYYFVLALVFAEILISHYPLSAEGTQHFIKEALAYITFTHDTYPSRIGQAFVFWSLATEMKFYLLSPFIVLGLSLLTPARRYAALAATLALLLLLKIALYLMTGGAEDYYTYFTHIRRPFYMAIDSLVAGVFCQYLWSDPYLNTLLKKKSVSTIMFYSGAALIIGLMGFTTPYWADNQEGLSFFSHSFIFTFIATGFSAMLLGLLGGAPGHKIFETSFLRFIALISYSLYLLHTFLVPVSIQYAATLAGGMRDSFSVWSYGFLILLTLSAVPAFFLYQFIEKPFINWSKR